VWLEYRAEKLLLRISAEDSIKHFLAGRAEADTDTVGQAIEVAARIAEQNQDLKEIVGRFRDDDGAGFSMAVYATLSM
jgi:hypothetical protein